MTLLLIVRVWCVAILFFYFLIDINSYSHRHRLKYCQIQGLGVSRIDSLFRDPTAFRSDLEAWAASKNLVLSSEAVEAVLGARLRPSAVTTAEAAAMITDPR